MCRHGKTRTKLRSCEAIHIIILDLIEIFNVYKKLQNISDMCLTCCWHIADIWSICVLHFKESIAMWGSDLPWGTEVLSHCVRDHGQAKIAQISNSFLLGNYVFQCPNWKTIFKNEWENWNKAYLQNWYHLNPNTYLNYETGTWALKNKSYIFPYYAYTCSRWVMIMVEYC